MLQFKEHKNMVQEMEENIHLILYILENEYEHTESELTEGINDWLKKAGLKLGKEKGLIDYTKNFTKGAGQMILAAIKGDKKKVKEIASSVKREEVIDFLLKLDMATLHIVMGPVHFIDAVTGWELHANITKTVKGNDGLISSFHTAVKNVKDHIMKLTDDPERRKMLKHLAILDMSIALPLSRITM